MGGCLQSRQKIENIVCNHSMHLHCIFTSQGLQHVSWIDGECLVAIHVPAQADTEEHQYCVICQQGLISSCIKYIV